MLHLSLICLEAVNRSFLLKYSKIGKYLPKPFKINRYFLNIRLIDKYVDNQDRLTQPIKLNSIQILK